MLVIVAASIERNTYLLSLYQVDSTTHSSSSFGGLSLLLKALDQMESTASAMWTPKVSAVLNSIDQ